MIQSLGHVTREWLMREDVELGQARKRKRPKQQENSQKSKTLIDVRFSLPFPSLVVSTRVRTLVILHTHLRRISLLNRVSRSTDSFLLASLKDTPYTQAVWPCLHDSSAQKEGKTDTHKLSSL